MKIIGRTKDIEINSISEIEEFIISKKISKSFKRATEKTIDQFRILLSAKSMKYSELMYKLRKILATHKGGQTLSDLIDIFGWNKEELSAWKELLTNRRKKYIERTGDIDINKRGSIMHTLYWTSRGYTEEQAKEQVSKVQSENSKRISSVTRRKISKRCVEYWTSRGYTEEQAKEQVSKVQSENSQRSSDYWTSRGYTEEQAKEQVSKVQSISALKYYSNTPIELRRQNKNMCVEYYIKHGIDKETAREIISERQVTFSLEKCIKKHGEELGYSIWKDRQDRWQTTMKNLPPEEIARINALKSTKVNFSTLWGDSLTEAGIFYIIKLDNSKSKIGITSKSTIFSRYKRKDLLGKEFLVWSDLTLLEAFQVEQVVKRKFLDHIIRDDYGPFGWTEVIHKDFESIKNSCLLHINNKESTREEFNKLRNT